MKTTLQQKIMRLLTRNFANDQDAIRLIKDIVGASEPDNMMGLLLPDGRIEIRLTIPSNLPVNTVDAFIAQANGR